MSGKVAVFINQHEKDLSPLSFLNRAECYGWDLKNQAAYIRELAAKQQRERDVMYEAGLEEEENYQRRIKV